MSEQLTSSSEASTSTSHLITTTAPQEPISTCLAPKKIMKPVVRYSIDQLINLKAHAAVMPKIVLDFSSNTINDLSSYASSYSSSCSSSFPYRYRKPLTMHSAPPEAAFPSVYQANVHAIPWAPAMPYMYYQPQHVPNLESQPETGSPHKISGQNIKLDKSAGPQPQPQHLEYSPSKLNSTSKYGYSQDPSPMSGATGYGMMSDTSQAALYASSYVFYEPNTNMAYYVYSSDVGSSPPYIYQNDATYSPSFYY